MSMLPGGEKTDWRNGMNGSADWSGGGVVRC